MRDYALCQLCLDLEINPFLPLNGYSFVDRDLRASSMMCWSGGVFCDLAVSEEALSVRDRMGMANRGENEGSRHFSMSQIRY